MQRWRLLCCHALTSHTLSITRLEKYGLNGRAAFEGTCTKHIQRDSPWSRLRDRLGRLKDRSESLCTLR